MDDKTAVFEIQAALNLIEKVYKDMICLLPSLLPHWISFEHLWSLIPPGSLIVSRDDLGFMDIWRALGCTIRKAPDGTFLFITADHIVWDGDEMGYSYRTLQIAEFSGLMMIDDLPYIPLKHHPNQEEVMQIVRQRSDKAIKFWKRGYQLQEHQGTGLAKVKREIQPYAVSKALRENGWEWRCSPVTYPIHSVQRTRGNRPGHDAKYSAIEQYHTVVAENASHFSER